MREYIVVLKSDPYKHWYSVDALSKRVARWCALNMFQNEYCGPKLKPRDFKAYTVKQKVIKDAKELGI
jgi:hypothetical protein